MYWRYVICVTDQAIYRGGAGERERPYSSGGAPGPPSEPATRIVTMSRDPADSHGFGICVKGGKEAGERVTTTGTDTVLNCTVNHT